MISIAGTITVTRTTSIAHHASSHDITSHADQTADQFVYVVGLYHTDSCLSRGAVLPRKVGGQFLDVKIARYKIGLQLNVNRFFHFLDKIKSFISFICVWLISKLQHIKSCITEVQFHLSISYLYIVIFSSLQRSKV